MAAEKRRTDELSLSEKGEDVVDASVEVSSDGDKDEALKLVGLERVGVYTEEQYLRVRRKLVSRLILAAL